MNTLLQKIPERIVAGKRLGRHVRYDERSRQYQITRGADTPIQSALWLASNHEALDQGDLGACTGFASAHALNCSPFDLRLTNKDALDIYALATTKDPWPGSYPPDDTGSSGLAAMQACRELGYIKSWSNAYTLDDVLHGLQTRPGILGITWFDGCDEPGVAIGQIAPTGHVRGGHETAIVGCEVERGMIVLRNSWGNGYGVKCRGQTGYFRLSYLEFATLLALTGDAIFPGSAMTPSELRQKLCNVASAEQNSTDAAKYWREVLPRDWRGPYPRHWCGAFTLWALRTVLGCSWQWEIGKGYLYRLPRSNEPELGDVCYMALPYQHHAILTAIGETTDGHQYVISQDGNSGPFPGVCEEHWRAREKWTSFYSIQPLVEAAFERLEHALPG